MPRPTIHISTLTITDQYCTLFTYQLNLKAIHNGTTQLKLTKYRPTQHRTTKHISTKHKPTQNRSTKYRPTKHIPNRNWSM